MMDVVYCCCVSRDRKMPMSSSKTKKEDKMTKREIVKMAKSAKDGIVEFVAETTPALNKYARGKRTKDGKRVACPFTGVTKRTKFKLDLNATYEPKPVENGKVPVVRAAWTKPTEFKFLKESANKKGKFYLFGKVVSAKSEWFVDGKKINRAKLANYLPKKGEREGWISVGISNIEA